MNLKFDSNPTEPLPDQDFQSLEDFALQATDGQLEHWYNSDITSPEQFEYINDCHRGTDYGSENLTPDEQRMALLFAYYATKKEA